MKKLSAASARRREPPDLRQNRVALLVRRARLDIINCYDDQSKGFAEQPALGYIRRVTIRDSL